MLELFSEDTVKHTLQIILKSLVSVAYFDSVIQDQDFSATTWELEHIHIVLYISRVDEILDKYIIYDFE